MAKKIPKNVRERRQLNLYVNSEERMRTLERVREVFFRARSLSDAVFSALDEWLDFGPFRAELEHHLSIVATTMQAARKILAKIEDPEVREDTYSMILSALLSELVVDALVVNQDKLSSPLLDEDKEGIHEWFRTVAAITDPERRKKARATWRQHSHEIHGDAYRRMTKIWIWHRRRFLSEVDSAEDAERMMDEEES